MGRMKTTLELPDELLREIKIRAVNENRRIKDIVAEALRRGLDKDPITADQPRRRIRLPLVECAHPAHPDEEMTPDRIALLLAGEDAVALTLPES